jgi:hypothetical protein
MIRFADLLYLYHSTSNHEAENQGCFASYEQEQSVLLPQEVFLFLDQTVRYME